MELDEQLRKLDLLRTVERRHRSSLERTAHGRVDVGIRVAEDARADAGVTHVDVAVPVEIPDLVARGARVVGRPQIR
jgi:hypothetical protein